MEHTFKSCWLQAAIKALTTLGLAAGAGGSGSSFSLISAPVLTTKSQRANEKRMASCVNSDDQ